MSFSVTLQNGVSKLQDDHQNGARILALEALRVLDSLLDEKFHNAVNVDDIWKRLCHAAWDLKNARPSMDAAIGGGLVQALQAVKRIWLERYQVDVNASGAHPLTDDARGNLLTTASMAIRQTIDGRRQNGLSVALCFQEWMQQKMDTLGRPTIRILTLSYSSSIEMCLNQTLREVPSICLELRIMESRPGCEGASLASSLIQAASSSSARNRLSVQVEPDSSVAILARDIDVVLLGADRISPDGDTSNKTGSLAAAICAKTVSPSVEVVVIAESDKIAKSGLSGHVEEENDKDEVTGLWKMEERWRSEIKVRNVYFEWVGSRWIDRYICEKGSLGKDEIRSIAAEVTAREQEIFGRFDK